MRRGCGSVGIETDFRATIRLQKLMLKHDDSIVKYPDNPGFWGAETDAGSGNRVQGSSKADLGDDIS